MDLQLTVLLLLAGPLLRAAEAPPFAHERLGVADGCFVESVALYDAVGERFGADAWRRVLQWGAREDDEIVAGHAVAVIEHQRRLWVWDVNFGWMPSPVGAGQREDASVVAAPVTAKYPRIEARHPLYRHDFPQTAATVPSVERTDAAVPALRDASRAAARLGRYRPVNLVEFTHLQGGETRSSAACVFIFHGRLCVYLPGHGTVPFRVRALSVENLRQLQECLRRIYPGAVVKTGGS